jgi:hypothetical protein
MRKLVSLGLFALMISIYSSQVLASNATACDDAKDELTKAGKGLYGLCIAWDNAKGKNKGKIAAKFEDRADQPITDFVGGPSTRNPAPDFFCPCWTDISFNDVCSLGSPSLTILAGYINAVEFLDSAIPQDEFFTADPRGCGYEGGLAPYASLEKPEGADWDLDCIAEIEQIAAMYDGGACE